MAFLFPFPQSHRFEDGPQEQVLRMFLDPFPPMFGERPPLFAHFLFCEFLYVLYFRFPCLFPYLLIRLLSFFQS